MILNKTTNFTWSLESSRAGLGSSPLLGNLMTSDEMLFQRANEKVSQILSGTMGGILVKVLHFMAEMSEFRN